MIEVSHITKTYRGHGVTLAFAMPSAACFGGKVIRALDDVSFTMEDGEMVGYRAEWGRQAPPSKFSAES